MSDFNGLPYRFKGGRVIEARTATEVPLTFKAAAGQTANMLEIKDSDDTVLFAISKSGGIDFSTVDVTVSDLTVNGDLDVTGAVTFSGGMTLGDEDTDELGVYSSFVSQRTPSAAGSAFEFDTASSWADSSSRLLTLKNNGAVKFAFYSDGSALVSETLTVRAGVGKALIFGNIDSNDVVGQIIGRGKDSGGADEDYASIKFIIDDATAGAETSYISFGAHVGSGSIIDLMEIGVKGDAFGLFLNDPNGSKINDANGNETLELEVTASAVNYAKIIPSATGNGVSYAVAGDDDNIDLILAPKGTGNVTVDKDVVIGGNADSDFTITSTSGSIVADYGADTFSVSSIASTFTGALTVGVDATGHDVTFFGDTTGKKLLWDQSEDTLQIDGNTKFNDDILASDEVSGITRGVIQTRTIDSATVKALLDGNKNTLTTFSQNVLIFDVIFATLAAAGSASTCDIGSDANISAGDVGNTYIDDVDLNSNGAQERTTIAGNAGQNGTLVTGATGSLTIQSSSDQSASSWSGMVIIQYAASNGS